MNKWKNILLLTTIVLFVACEYVPSDSNFVGLTPPEDYIPNQISLNDVPLSDTICMYKNTSISIKIKSPNDLQEVVVLLDGAKYLSLENKSLNFDIDPNQLREGVHTLTVSAVFTSQTGSLAEKMGLENYMGELSWHLNVVHNPQDHFMLGHRINEEGFVEIYWKNVVPDSVFEKYTVHSGLTQKTDVSISDPSQKSFVDSGYVCGYVYYEVSAFLKDGSFYLQRHSINTTVPKIYFEDLGLDSLRIFWDRPYANGRFYLNNFASGITDTTITIPQLFGENRQFSLEIRPRNAKFDNTFNISYAWDWFCQGTSLGLPNWELYAYNLKDNILYTRIYNDLVAFDATSLQIKNSVTIDGKLWGFAYGGKIATAPHNSTVAAMTGEETWIFTDSRFINPVKISPLPGSIHTRLASLTSDDRFFVVQKDSTVCTIFNTLTGEKITDFPFTYKTIYDIPEYVTVSYDGKYFCASSENGMEVFEIIDTTTTLLYTDTRDYQAAIFVPTQSDKLLLRVDSAIEIRQIPGFNLIQTLDISAEGATICNIDPASMSLLYYQNHALKVCKINDISETIFKIRSDQKTCKMYNNKLLTYGKGGISFDISPYLSY